MLHRHPPAAARYNVCPRLLQMGREPTCSRSWLEAVLAAERRQIERHARGGEIAGALLRRCLAPAGVLWRGAFAVVWLCVHLGRFLGWMGG